MDSRAGRIVLTVAGSVCVALGTVGVFVPVLPTTPFLLLAAACFLRSSPRLHAWLLGHRHLGPYVAGFVDGRGISRHRKRMALVTLWLFIGLSGAVVTRRGGPVVVWGTTVLVLLVVAVLVTRYILRRPTLPG